MFQEYRKTATVRAKLFERGDEDGFLNEEANLFPYVRTINDEYDVAGFGRVYLCVDVESGGKWFVKKEIFESTYELIGK